MLALGACVVIAGANYHRYFGVQTGHPLVWDKFATAQTIIAEAVNAHSQDTDIYTIIGFYGHPTIQFLAHSQGGTLFHGLQERLPPAPQHPRPRRAAVPRPAQRQGGALVPGALPAGDGGRAEPPHRAGVPVLFAVHIPNADLRATQRARYRPDRQLTGRAGHDEDPGPAPRRSTAVLVVLV